MQTTSNTAALRRAPKRAGFTMLELLVTISIIALLISIGAYAIANSISQAKEKATRALLLKLDGLLQQRLDGFGTLIKKPQMQTNLQTNGIPMVYSGLNAYSPAIVGVPKSMMNLMAYKEFFRVAFPQTGAYNPVTSVANLSSTAALYFSGNTQNSAESSEFLFWIITKADTYAVSPVDDSEFTASEVKDTDADGRLEFVDAWGRPLRFYRWPTRIFRPGGAGTAISTTVASLLISGLPDPVDLQIDPDDAIGVYDATVAAGVITPAQYERLYQTPDTYSIPLIVSSGADGASSGGLGLYEPYDFANFGNLAQPLPGTLANPGASALNDNLTNRQKLK